MRTWQWLLLREWAMTRISESVVAYLEQQIRLPYEAEAPRMDALKSMAAYIKSKNSSGQPLKLAFICTHNSRRSQFAQLWAKVCADYFDLTNCDTYSWGSEVTQMHVNTVNCLRNIGFSVNTTEQGSNPVRSISYSASRNPLLYFSKRQEHPENPAEGFAAIMTCSAADEQCPFVAGAEMRISLPYDDPGWADGTEEEAEAYSKCCAQIARDMAMVMDLAVNGR